MTAPANQSPAEQGLSPAEEAAIVAVAVFLASVVAVKAVMLPVTLVRRLALLGLSTRAIRVAGRLTLQPAMTGRTRWGSPTLPGPSKFGRVTMARRMAADEPTMRARYLLAAAKRLTMAATRGEFTAGLRREQSYLAAHRRAGQKRAKAARDYDQAARGHQYMVWVTAGDGRVDAHCRALENSVWSVDNPPPVIPGAVHPWCRCVARPLGAHRVTQAAA